jgi:hypothetical protein
MQQILRKFFIAALLCLALPCLATTQSRDGNDLWIIPEESGWGANIFHQGNTLFVSLFVYGNDGRARWYTASSLVGNEPPLGDHPTIYSGPLYESTGPAFGAAFDPSRVTRRQVGTMSVEFGSEVYTTGTPRRYAVIYYDVDGVQVRKQTYAFSFGAIGLTGSYTGFASNASGTREEVGMNVTLNNRAFTMTTSSPTTSCTYTGQQIPQGSVFDVQGTYVCGSGASRAFSLAAVDVTRHGFTASFYAEGTPWTNLAGERTSSAIRGDGYATDLWFPPDESGWGLNIIEQGDTQFGTMFVYDAAGQPRWYSASNLTYEQCAPPDSGSDCWGRYRGTLVESTGPYLGTTFNPSAVQRRVVGTMSIDYFGNDTAYLDYTIDGVTVTRKQVRRYAFRTNTLAGSYAGHILALNGNNDRGMQTGAMTIEISESGTAVTMVMRGNKGICTMRGTRFQYGRQVMVSGPYDCGGAAFGQLSLMDVYVTAQGFTGRVDFGTQPGMNDFYSIGRIEAARTTAN